MSKCILITGGAGFIGSHLADELLCHGYRIHILDPQPAFDCGKTADRTEVEWFQGSVEDAALLTTALAGVDAVVHLAARPGDGRGFPGLHPPVLVHVGTPLLLEALMGRAVERLILASDSCVYGEGLYREPSGTLVNAPPRSPDQLGARAWDPRDAAGTLLTPVPTPEATPLSLTSACALSHYDQERMGLLIGRAHAIPTTVLRFFNVYGPRQPLDFPHPNVLARFAARLLAGAAPLVFEDGRQRHDFVHVRDAARACRQAIESPAAVDRVINVGSGEGLAVVDLARQLAAVLGRPVEPEITQRHRPGDVRHRFADLSLAHSLLGFVPRIPLAEGLANFAGWWESRMFTAGRPSSPPTPARARAP